MKQSELKTAEELIFDERIRQISQEGWTTEHDDQHIHGELAKAADCYYEYAEDNDYTDTEVHQYWPWEKEWWKPKYQLRDYIRAGALYRAEKERLERTGGAIGPKLTNLRIGIRQCEIKIDEILSHEAYCAKKDRTPTLPVGIKTAEEIYEQFTLDENPTKKEVLKAIHAYHAQFTHSAKSVEAEEEDLADAAWQGFNSRLGTDKDGAYFHGFYDGSNWQQQKQADTIVELREENERLNAFIKKIANITALTISNEGINLRSVIEMAQNFRKEALKEKES